MASIVIGHHVKARMPTSLRSNAIRKIVGLNGELAPGFARALGVDAVQLAPLIDGRTIRLER